MYYPIRKGIQFLIKLGLECYGSDTSSPNLAKTVWLFLGFGWVYELSYWVSFSLPVNAELKRDRRKSKRFGNWICMFLPTLFSLVFSLFWLKFKVPIVDAHSHTHTHITKLGCVLKFLPYVQIYDWITVVTTAKFCLTAQCSPNFDKIWIFFLMPLGFRFYIRLKISWFEKNWQFWYIICAVVGKFCVSMYSKKILLVCRVIPGFTWSIFWGMVVLEKVGLVIQSLWTSCF